MFIILSVEICVTYDEDWLKKCMEFRVEGRRPVGRPRRTLLESVEADMAELEIDKEDVHDRKKRKTDYKPIIYCVKKMVLWLWSMKTSKNK